MAEPLKSLLTMSTSVKHVVAWKTRQEFESVYEDLFHEDTCRRQSSIDRIATWKSRVGAKLSVAIESSASLCQVQMDHQQALADRQIHTKDTQLRASSSLALIRFVNHVTEKAQNKASAQPVHLIAREFGIPEWIVRLRHDATHGLLPCLDVLMTGVNWGVDYLKKQFWQQQVEDQRSRDECPDAEKRVKKCKISHIRKAMYDFQKARFEEINSPVSEEKEGKVCSHSTVLATLQSYLTQDRSKFINCLLEDGVLVFTVEQLAVFGVDADDLLDHSPPTMPMEVSLFWSPLLRKLYTCGALPLLMNTALFSVGAECSLRNYQLVAWLSHLLGQSSGPSLKGKRKKRRRPDDLVKGPIHIPKKTLLASCLQNITPYTVHLLKFLADKQSLGTETYEKLMKLLNLDPESHDPETGGVESDEERNGGEEDGGDAASSGEESDSHIYTVEDLKREKLKKQTSGETTRTEGGGGASVEQVQDSLSTSEASGLPWTVCTDLVDWTTVPIGELPKVSTTVEESEDESEDEADVEVEALRGDGTEAGDKGSDSSEGEQEVEGEKEADYSTPVKKRRKDSDVGSGSDCVSPKRSVFTPKDDVEVL